MQPDDTNPYAPPINLEPLAPQQAVGVWRFASSVLVEPSGQLPNRCIRCGKSSDTVSIVSTASRPAEAFRPQQWARLVFIAVAVVCFLLLTWSLPVAAPRLRISPLFMLIAASLLCNLMILTRMTWGGSSRTTVTYCMCRFHNSLRRFYRLSDISLQIFSPNMILLSALVPTNYSLAVVIVACVIIAILFFFSSQRDTAQHQRITRGQHFDSRL